MDISRILNKIIGEGGIFNILVLVFGFVVVGYWFKLIVNKKFKKALYFLIILFPFTYYAGRFFGIVGINYNAGSWSFDQFIGPTTFLIVILFISILYSKKKVRPTFKEGKIFEMAFFLFSVSITISQFINHDFFAAIILSIGAAWQFLLLFYIILNVIESKDDIRKMIDSIFIFSVLNIIVRVFAKGESFTLNLLNPSTGITPGGRVGSGALGPAVSYGGYLGILISLALGMYFIYRNKIYILYIILMFVELLNTFTRGGIFLIFLILVLGFFKKYRSFFYRVAPLMLVLILPFINKIMEYLSIRGLAADVLNSDSVFIRILLNIYYFKYYYHFSIFGNGILNNTYIYLGLGSNLSLPLHNAYLEVLDTCGILAFILFIILTIYVMYVFLKKLKYLDSPVKYANNSERYLSIRPILFIATLQWFIFANTTSTSILAYYPYEGTAIFWLLSFSALVFVNKNQHLIKPSNSKKNFAEKEL